MRFSVIERKLTNQTEQTSEASNALILISGARLLEADGPDGLPHLRIEPRVTKGLTISQSQDFLDGTSGTLEKVETSKLGLKLKPVPTTAFFYGFEYEQDLTVGKLHEWFLKPKLGAGLGFNATTGAIEASGAAVGPATTSSLGVVSVGTGLNVTGPGVHSLGIASASVLGGIRIGSGLSIDGSGVVTAAGGGGATLSGGTTNVLTKWTSATTVGTSQVFDNGTGVMIGGTSPSGKFDVVGTAGTSGETGIVQVGIAGSSGLAMGYDSTNNWSWLYSRTVGVASRGLNLNNTVYITGANGNVGIGPTTPTAKWQLLGGALSTASDYSLGVSSAMSTGRLSSGGASKIASIHNTRDDALLEISTGAGSGNITGIVLGGRTYGGDGVMEDAVSLWTRSTQRVTVDGAGNVGIGTAAPTVKLDVVGAARLGGNLQWSTDAAFDVGASGQNRPRDVFLSRKAVIGSDPVPGSGAGSLSTLRVAGTNNAAAGSVDAAYFGGVVYATDFVLLAGTGALATAGPPIQVRDEGTEIIPVTTPLSVINFVGQGVIASASSGTLTVTIPGGSVEAVVVGVASSYITSGTMQLNYATATTWMLTRDVSWSNFSIANIPSSGAAALTLVLLHNGTTTTQGWGSTKWGGGAVPSLSVVTGRYDVLSFFMVNGTIFGFVSGLGFV